jgi:hypothetical protein
MPVKRLVRYVSPFLLPVLTQVALQTLVMPFWRSGWDRMNDFPTIWGMAAILGPSLLIGTWFLARTFKWYAAPMALIYLPAMVIVLSWIAARV